MLPEIENLLKIIEGQLGWGESKTWQSRDFENLNQLILDKTGVSLSASTLRRIWGRVEYRHLPSGTTLDTLARFAGFETWRAFTKQHAAAPAAPVVENASPAKSFLSSRTRLKIAGLLLVIAAISIAGIFAMKKSRRPVNPAEYSFSSRPVTREIPNSVIFTYDASASPTDSVFIQQSWDDRTRTLVDKHGHQHTAVYYEPGFYHAKLFAGDKVVKEHPLMIPTNGWLGLIATDKVPVYLQQQEFIQKDHLHLPVSVIEQKNIPMGPNPPMVKFYNVGNFDPVPVTDFSFSAAMKNEYSEGAAACRYAALLLITDTAPIYISLSAPGCVSEISLMCFDDVVSGKKNDLSAFGVDFSNWVQVGCRSSGNKIQYDINGKTVYTCEQPSKKITIRGIAFFFQGTGAVKNVNLESGTKKIFRAFE